MSHFGSTILVNPKRDELAQAIDQFERSEGFALHEVAVTNLNETTFDLTDPFPRLEDHGSYLFGEFATPTSLVDGADLYISIHFVISFGYVILVVRTPNNDPFADSTNLMVRKITDVCVQSRGQGWFVVDLLRCLVLDIESKVLEVAQELDHALAAVVSTFDYDAKDLSPRKIAELYLAATRFRVDILGVRTTITETTKVMRAVSDDQLDLRPSDFSGREFFDRELELHIEDLHVRLRRLTALRDNLEATVAVTFDKFDKLDDQSQTNASRNMTAIASLMLLPSFLVGFFGQNFRFHQVLDYEWGWALSISAIALVTLAQVVFFRRKRWI